MKRRNQAPAIAPFVDQWGNPAWTNPCNQYRPNPALNATAPSEPVVQPIALNKTAAIAQPAVVAEPAALTAPVIATATSEAHEVATENTAASIPDQSAPRLHMNMAAASWDDTIAPTTTHSANDAIDTASPAYLATRARYRTALGLDTDETPVEHTPNRAERRALIHRRIRRSVAVVTAIGSGFVGITAASAYFTSNSSGTGSATTGTLSVTVSDTTGTPTTPLYPGGTSDVTLKVNNPNNFDVTLTAVSGNGSIDPDVGHASCNPTGVTFTDQTPNLTLPANTNDIPVDLAGAASMDLTSANGCQGATFTIPVSITVQK